MATTVVLNPNPDAFDHKTQAKAGTLSIGNKNHQVKAQNSGSQKIERVVAKDLRQLLVDVRKKRVPLELQQGLPQLKHVQTKTSVIQATTMVAKNRLSSVVRLSDLFKSGHGPKQKLAPSDYVKAAQQRFEMNSEVQAKLLLKEVEKIQAALDANIQAPPGAPPPKSVNAKDIDKVLSGFMGLMERIVDQIGGEGEALFAEIDQTTKQMEFLTDFRTKIGAVTAPLELEGKDAGLKVDFEKAIALGVKIDPTKMTYDEAEKKVLSEAVAGKRENIVHISQQQRMKIQNNTQKTTETYTMWSSIMKSLHSAIMRILEHVVTGR
jgi:hypothetical protein